MTAVMLYGSLTENGSRTGQRLWVIVDLEMLWGSQNIRVML